MIFRSRPDILLFPETVWGSSQNIGFLETPLATSEDRAADTFTYSKLCHDATSALARGEYAEVNRVLDTLERLMPRRYLQTLPGERLPRLKREAGPPMTIVLGTIALEVDPGGGYPRNRKSNSAVVYDVDGTQRRQRYDKNHLVPFGEYVPFRQARFLGLDMHWLYVWLNSLSPFSHGGKIEYSLLRGDRLATFNIAFGGETLRFGTPICYEDVMPYLVRRYVWGGDKRRVDFLLNMSNDGWFQHSAELPQHLAICTFRAVENRVGIARAVNTGVSGFIDPCGRVYNIVRRNHNRYGVGSVGVETAAVRLDSRTPLYGLWGDWLPRMCLALSAVMWLGGVVTRWIAAVWRRVAGRLGRRATT
jgi:apolipoprotein N-acyltransferase